MWELDYEESWAPKNWCFWSVVLEKTLESPLDCKEIQPVHPEGDQSWVFIGRTDAEAETPVLWPPHAKSWGHLSSLDEATSSKFLVMCVQFSSVTQSCLTLCDPMNRSMPGLPVYHQLPEFTQIHAHWVGDAIQPSHPLSSPSPPAPNPSQHQGLFQWVSSSHEVATSSNIANLSSVSMSLLFLDYISKWDNTVFIFLCLISLSRMPSRSIHVIANDKIFLLYGWVVFCSVCVCVCVCV